MGGRALGTGRAVRRRQWRERKPQCSGEGEGGVTSEQLGTPPVLAEARIENVISFTRSVTIKPYLSNSVPLRRSHGFCKVTVTAVSPRTGAQEVTCSHP